LLGETPAAAVELIVFVIFAIFVAAPSLLGEEGEEEEEVVASVVVVGGGGGLLIGVVVAFLGMGGLFLHIYSLRTFVVLLAGVEEEEGVEVLVSAAHRYHAFLQKEMVVAVVGGLLGIKMVRPTNYYLYTLSDYVAVEEEVGHGVEGVHDQMVAGCHKSREERWIGDEKRRLVAVEWIGGPAVTFSTVYDLGYPR